MFARSRGHGCLAAIGFLTAGAALADPPARVQTRVFDLHYEVDRAAMPVESVSLWYTADDGRTWHQYGFDDDGQSPMTFTAPGEGRFGFYFVVTNSAGASGPPPDAETKPHAGAYVDYTPPVVQVYPPKTTQMLGRRVVQISWTALDAHLTPRPIELEYRRPAATSWTRITESPLANAGRYDWRVPDGLTGPLIVRVAVTDEGGHRVFAESPTFEVPPYAPPEPKPEDTSTKTPPSIEDINRAMNLYREGVSERQRGESRMAVSLLRRAVSLNPEFTEALSALGETYLDLRAFDAARSAFELALLQNPALRGALRGSAKLDLRGDDYASAAGRLRMIVEQFPKDAEAWMDLGDVAIYQGDDVSARAFYQRAATVDPSASPIVEAARARLDLLMRSSRAYAGERSDG